MAVAPTWKLLHYVWRPAFVGCLLGLLALGAFPQQANSVLVTSATISGTLLKADGRPRKHMELQLVPPDSRVIVNDSRLIAVSDERGRFAFKDVPEGTYTLSIKFNDLPTALSPYSTFFYPATENRKHAEIFEIRAGTQREGMLFRLPPELVEATIKGRVVWADTGEPVADAWIACGDLDFGYLISFGRHFSRPDGTFAMPAYTGRRYRVAAIALDGKPEVFSLMDREIKLLGVAETDEFKLPSPQGVLELRLLKPEDIERKEFLEKYIAGTNTTNVLPAIGL